MKLDSFNSNEDTPIDTPIYFRMGGKLVQNAAILFHSKEQFSLFSAEGERNNFFGLTHFSYNILQRVTNDLEFGG